MTGGSEPGRALCSGFAALGRCEHPKRYTVTESRYGHEYPACGVHLAQVVTTHLRPGATVTVQEGFHD